jgi:HSP20 family protein
MGLLHEWKQGLGEAFDSLADGWREVRDRTSSALTRFLPGSLARGDDAAAPDEPPVGGRWAVLGADVYEDDESIVVRLEAPGMRKQDFAIQLRDYWLIVEGEKRAESESRHGRWREVQCAYGRFRRAVPLPAAVRADKAEATYRAGVLRVELRKSEPGRTRRITVREG